MSEIDIDSVRRMAEKKDRYEYQLNRLKKANKQTSCIEEAVTRAAGQS